MNTLDLFKVMIIVMLFYSVAITGLTYVLPDTAKQYVTGFSSSSTNLDLETTSQQFTQSLEQQRSIPIIDMGALVFYSGNILIDLLLNFYFAIPQMIGFLFNAIALIFPALDAPFLVPLAQAFMSALITILYIIAIIQTLMSLRSGREVV